jgi:hypothetical protein
MSRAFVASLSFTGIDMDHALDRMILNARASSYKAKEGTSSLSVRIDLEYFIER